MDNLDDSENNAKVSDSAYSNSCSNSQSRRSHSSKSTHSGSHSSRSSGYGGKPSVYRSGQPSEKRSKSNILHLEKPTEVSKEAAEDTTEQAPVVETTTEQIENVELALTPLFTIAENGPEVLDKGSLEKSSNIEEVSTCISPYISGDFDVSRAPSGAEGFSCVISMHDGVVMYTTTTITTTLGFPKEMWIGRSFIDFIHARDRNTFASHITSGLAVPKNVNGTIQEVPSSTPNIVCTMVCRLRKYRCLASGFGVKESSVSFMPFQLKLSFKNISDDEGKATYLVIQATPSISAFKVPNEKIENPIPFVIRHAANGNVEYIDPEAVPFLGYLPQDLEGNDALMLYHPDDLSYLRQVYETIVKEGGMSRSQPYRIITQNWDFVRVETEWSSFINPWSKKLEFVVGKHHILEGPTNPDVFQSPAPTNIQKFSQEEKDKAQCLREVIKRIMNEVLTKPAEAAKQQMSKRCQDLASFMESLMEDHTKTEEELHVEVQDPDNSYYERDSVMLGGISPHHDHNDSKSSFETTLSYNQLNYNDTLQRYFDSHQPYSYEDYNTATGENVLDPKSENSSKRNVSSMAQMSAISGEISSCESAGSIGDISSATIMGEMAPKRLTKTLISKHNTEMEKELMKIHRETRSSKGDRKKVVIENRQKKKEHLARCNATFQPTDVANTGAAEQPHGTKRASKQGGPESVPHKHHCPAPRPCRRRQTIQPSTSAPHPTTTINTTVASTVTSHWPQNCVNGMNTFFLGVGFPPQMSVMSPMGGMPGMIPMYYAPAFHGMPSGSNMSNSTFTSNGNPQFQQPMPCMMYGQAIYGPPLMYSTVNPQMTYPPQAHTHNPLNQPLGLANSNYEEACKQSVMKTEVRGGLSMFHGRERRNKNPLYSPREGLVGTYRTGYHWREKQFQRYISPSMTDQEGSSSSNFSSRITLNRSTNASRMRDSKRSGDEAVDRTDGESSYSSFYSSFFKTESGSAEESGDARKTDRGMDTTNTYYEPPQVKKIAKRKMDPPWTEQVCVTSELIYKYQVLTKNLKEVLKADQLKMSKIEQSPMVNEQLAQLYLDLQLEGVAAKLSLEEGITSSSSGEESAPDTAKVRRKKNYNKLAVFFEEDAPLEDGLPDEAVPLPFEKASTSAI